MSVLKDAMVVITLITYITAVKHGYRKQLIQRPKTKPEELDASFRAAKIVPDIIPFAPNDLLEVKFIEREAEYGNHLSVIHTVYRPRVAFNDSDDSREDDSLYTLMLVNVDGGDPHNLLWLVTNIVGDGYPTKGDQTVKYKYYSPPEGNTDRLVFLVYRQPTKTEIRFRESDFLTRGFRETFDILEFNKIYNFSKYPVAGNHFGLLSRGFAQYPRDPPDWMKPIIIKWNMEESKNYDPSKD